MSPNTVLWNWGRTAASHPGRIEIPSDLAALVDIVTRAAGPPPKQIRPMGHRHSVNHCFEADSEIQIDMSQFGVGEHPVVNKDAKTITVKAGATLLQVRDALRPYGLELPVSPEIGNATAGSVACAGTKDGSLRGRKPGIGQIASLVVEVKIVDAAGVPRTLNGPSLKMFRSSHGLLGIVHEVTFEAVTRELLQIEYEWLRLDPFPDRDRVFDRGHGQGPADGVLAFIQPYKRHLLVERRTRLPGEAGNPSPGDQLKRAIRDWTWEWGQTAAVAKAAGLDKIARALFAAVPSLTPVPEISPLVVATIRPLLDEILDRVAAVIPAGCLHHTHVPEITLALYNELEATLPALLPVGLLDGILGVLGQDTEEDILLKLVDRTPVLLEVLGGYRAHRSDSMIDFGQDRWPTVFDFTFWAFPQSRWLPIVQGYLDFCHAFLAETGYRPAIFSEVYFIDRDQNAALSFSPDEPIFTLNMVDSPRYIDGVWKWDPRWFEMNRRFNRWAVAKDEYGEPRKGRPLLNQTKELQATPEVLATAFGPDWTAFVKYVNAQDPAGRFRSKFFSGLGI